MERVKISKVRGGGNYFATPKLDLQFIRSGSKILDLALGGGWAVNRISNVVGDKSTGKTLLCIEAAANFALQYPKGMVKYREAEAAFDPKYAQTLGMPLNRVDFGHDLPLETVEDMFEDLTDVCKEKRPILYIMDSLDALSDRAEMGRDMDAGTYGAEKAKKLSQLFRRLTRAMAKANVTLLIVSQVRSKIGVSFGRTTTRTGGRALDFYASQVAYLAQVGTLVRTVGKVKRTTGVKIHARIDKNKIGLPYREADFTISFGFGIDDLHASLEWLSEAGYLSDVDVPKDLRTKLKTYARDIFEQDDEDAYRKEVDRIHEAVERRWYEIEQRFMPVRQKYRSV